jgi:hypothetical protein
MQKGRGRWYTTRHTLLNDNQFLMTIHSTREVAPPLSRLYFLRYFPLSSEDVGVIQILSMLGADASYILTINDKDILKKILIPYKFTKSTKDRTDGEKISIEPITTMRHLHEKQKLNILCDIDFSKR